MKYRKRLPQACTCAHCGHEFLSAHQRGKYCSNSCTNLASYARRRAAQRSLAPALAAPTPSLAVPAPLPAFNLAHTWHNAAFMTGCSVAAQLLVSLGERVYKAFTTPVVPPAAPTGGARPALPADPLHWLPAHLLAVDAPRVPLHLAWWEQPHVFLQLAYFGHTLYHQPTQRCLLWEVAPRQYLPVFTAEQLAQVAEFVPVLQRAQVPALPPAPRLQPKFLG
jgi:hypothetical protein